MLAGTLNVTSYDQRAKKFNENVGIINAEALLGENRAEFAQQIDTFARNFIRLTTHTYENSTVAVGFSINEILDEEG